MQAPNGFAPQVQAPCRGGQRGQAGVLALPPAALLRERADVVREEEGGVSLADVVLHVLPGQVEWVADLVGGGQLEGQ